MSEPRLTVTEQSTRGTVTGIISNLLTVEIDGPVSQHEICFVEHDGLRLRAEVIRIVGRVASVQIYESSRGLRVGQPVVFTGRRLEIALGPGILGKNYDGLQSDLEKMADTFLRRGEYTNPLGEQPYDFEPLAAVGDTVQAGDWLGQVKENFLDHKIMVPFRLEGDYKVKTLADAGAYRPDEQIATLADADGTEHAVTMTQYWPVKVPIRAYARKPRPFRILQTGVRAIDTYNPLAEGGTGFIPGPFGSGKTVLQHAIAKNGDADVIILTACGERANEVVDIFTEFPHLEDPRTGRKLQERTTIVCNTSNMPVAAREASVYVGMTLAEYYRAMGLKVLLLADSTSRWAQALREMSNRLEELPGPDAFPIDLSAIIANFYARAGLVYLRNGQTGSVTFLGTVSPAGGNLKEPVTESTRKVARAYYALSQQRADRKRYPAIEPVDSYSKYLEYAEFVEHTETHIQPGWADLVNRSKDVLTRGQEARDQINILGDDAVPIEYHERYWKSEVIDAIILQQDAFDPIDMNTPLERQAYMLNKVLDLVKRSFRFDRFEEVGTYFKRVINLLKQINYAAYESDDFRRLETELDTVLAEKQAS